MICRQNSVEEIGSMDVSFKNSSIRSSLCSLYKNYDFHLDILKIPGVIVLLSIMNATLAITSNLHKVDTTKNVTDCIRLTAQMEDQQFNTTFCRYIKQYPLPEKYFVTICSFQGEIRIDFRKFINNYPTIQGVYLNTRQWNYFKGLSSHIDEAIDKALSS
jgi:hypothetical protein